MRASASTFAIIALAVLGFATPASADRAPIVYASRDPQAGSPGATDNSYSYGPAPRANPNAAVIDLRRPAAQAEPAARPMTVTPQPAPIEAAVQQPAPASARPAWLEEERVGPPYQAAGRWYVPTPEPGYEMTGVASWYGPTFHGQTTSSGEVFDQEAITAAHPTLPIPCLVQVTNLANGREVIVRVNDRGPYVGDRVIDLSRGAARVLGYEETGTAQVRIRYLGPAPRPLTGGQTAQAAPNAPPAAPQPLASNGPTVLTPPPTPAATAVPPALDGAYVAQVGAYSEMATAQRIQAAVSSAGPVTIDARQTARGTVYRVRVGPFATAADAETARAAVARLGYGDCVVASR